MFIKIKEQLIELLEEEPPAQIGNGFMIAMGIILLSCGVFAAILAVIL